ncbi:type II secretion system F family protein [Paenibacillus chitinolyticus]|uniref:type II secretion system F family protein n=1 Tax=Paenibacillus chitinolyticus TaxID=79263 RepID=UPI0036D7E48A
MLLLLCLSMGSFLALLLLYALGSRHFTDVRTDYPCTLHMKKLAPAGLYAVERFKTMERFPDAGVRIMQRIRSLYGHKDTLVMSKLVMGDMLLTALLVLILSGLLGIAGGGDPAVALLGVLGAGLTPWLMLRQLDQQIRLRKRRIVLELPEVLSKMILLINAGETVQKALIRSVDTSRVGASPLHAEFGQAVRELEMNVSLPKVLEDLSKRCAMQEMALFTTTILLNYRRGGEDFLVALRSLAKELWDRRKAESRKLGEEASSKLVFPMVAIFLVVMIIVASPAVLSING